MPGTTPLRAQDTTSMGSMGVRGSIPDATVARLPVYLRALTALHEQGVTTVSSNELAADAGVNPAKLRKDLSYLGSYGTRGIGYPVEELRAHVGNRLGLTQDWPVVLVGLGNLGQALAKYSGFASRGFRIAALVDADPALVGTHVGDLRVQAVGDLPRIVREAGAPIGMVATPAEAAQEVCDALVAAGVSSILNFASIVLAVPQSVHVRKVDLAVELQILAFHEQHRAGVEPATSLRVGA